MRLKEIKPWMAIHCKNDEEKIALLEEAERLGYKWPNGCSAVDRRIIERSDMTIHFYDRDERCDFAYIACYGNTEDVTEFSDLILPELTAEEAIQCLGELYIDGTFAEVFGTKLTMSGLVRSFTPGEILEKISEYKFAHEKKEPEIETVDVCRIIEIQPNGFKRCVHEEDISPEPDGGERAAVENILKRYLMEHEGEYIAVHEVVSRVKAVE